VVNDPDVPPNLCFPGKEEVAEAVAAITGKAAGAAEALVAVVHCSRVQGDVHKKYKYIGYETCAGASLAFAGPMGCQYGCLGFGDCAAACPFDALHMVNGFPVVDPAACVACGNCVYACPKGLIKLIPRNARVIIPCSTKDRAKVTMSVCKVGCLHNRACIRKCPANAISEVDGVVTVDQKKCIAYGPACKEVCLSACKKVHILQPMSLEGTYKRLTEASAA